MGQFFILRKIRQSFHLIQWINKLVGMSPFTKAGNISSSEKIFLLIGHIPVFLKLEVILFILKAA